MHWPMPKAKAARLCMLRVRFRKQGTFGSGLFVGGCFLLLYFHRFCGVFKNDGTEIIVT